jgi:two-component system KDP operon response regulator KdpE
MHDNRLFFILEAARLNKVLIVEDDLNTPDLLKMSLESSGFDVIKADNPEDGIELARQHMPETVILDFIMPISNGIKVCQAIREFSQAPIIVLSVIDQPSIAAKVLDSGADDYLVKPIADSVLQARLRRITNRRNSKTFPSNLDNQMPAGSH